MSAKQLITNTFPKNMGGADSVFRVLSGPALIALPLVNLVSWPGWSTSAITVFGLLGAITGLRSRCSVYYLLGVSTRRDG